MERVNLIPISDRNARAARRRARKWMVALLCVLPLVIAAFLFRMYQTRMTDEAAAKNGQLVKSIEASRAVLGELRAEVARAESRLTRVRRMQDKRRWSALVAQLVDVIPPGVWLTSLASEPAVPTGVGGVVVRGGLPEADKAPKEFDIEAARGLIVKGVCVDPAAPLQFVAALKGTGMFESIGHEHVQRSGGDVDTYRFEIRCEW